MQADAYMWWVFNMTEKSPETEMRPRNKPENLPASEVQPESESESNQSKVTRSSTRDNATRYSTPKDDASGGSHTGFSTETSQKILELLRNEQQSKDAAELRTLRLELSKAREELDEQKRRSDAAEKEATIKQAAYKADFVNERMRA